MDCPLQIKSRNSLLSLSKENGALISLVAAHREFLLPAKQLFSLGFRSESGELSILSSNEFSMEVAKRTASSLTLLFRRKGLNVNVSIRCDGSMFYFKPEIELLLSSFLLEWIDLPQVSLSSCGTVFWPYTEGVLIDNPEKREESPWSRYHTMGFLSLNEEGAYSEGGYYPGVCQMQFLAWLKNGMGVYFGAHDFLHGTKGVEFAPDGNGRIRFSLQTFCGGCGLSYKPEFEYALRVFSGDWRDACKIYRYWIKDDPGLPPPGKLPEMVAESPVVMIYPVRGTGEDKGEMHEGNEYFPYVNALPVVRKYAEQFDSRILALLMHWEGTAPWAPPYVWPPFGGTDALKEYANGLHSEGNYLGVYCSGTAWTQKSCIVQYSREQECDENGLRKHMICGPHGEIDAVICNGEQAQRIGFDLCLTEKWSRDVVLNEILKLTEIPIDYAQFFDQNLGCGFHTCYSRDHRHPPVPGTWQTDAMRSLLEEANKEIHKKSSNMILGCEAAASEPYMKQLPFNDLRACFIWSAGRPVPAYQFVFHDRINNFMGNQCGISNLIDCKQSPENLLFRIGYSFNAGDLLSIVLKNGGEVHWGWSSSWNEEGPEQAPVIKLIRTLNTFRKTHSKFLQYGRMEKPRIKISGGIVSIVLRERNEDEPSFFHSAWISPDGSWGEVVTNYLKSPQKLRYFLPKGTRAFTNGVELPHKGVLDLPALSAMCILLQPK